MTGQDQMRFVRELADSIASDIVKNIAAGKVPESWDGHELRCLFSEKAKSYAFGTEIRRHARSRRARDYRDTVIVNNL